MAAPDWSAAIVPERKTTEYLLAQDHPEGGAKARYFLARGFQLDAAEAMAGASRTQAATGRKVSVINPFGVKYIIDGFLTCPDGRECNVRTIWIVEGEAPARFVTAYPQEVA